MTRYLVKALLRAGVHEVKFGWYHGEIQPRPFADGAFFF